jgi:hypothetical protein
MRPPTNGVARVPPAAGASTHVDRRSALQNFGAAALCAAAASGGVRPLPAAAAGSLLPPPPMNAGWLPLADFAAAPRVGAPSFPEPFVMYLSRFMLRYDERTAAWYGGASAALPSSWGAAQQRAVLSGALGEFGTSLSFRLAPLAASGASGAAALWDALVSAYGTRDGARTQLALLFCLLSPHLQPTEAMRAACEGAAARAPSSAGATATASELTTALAASPSNLLPASIVPVWDEGRRSYTLPPPALEALLPTSDKSGVLGAPSRAPISAERTLGPSIYGTFALAGGCGCSLTHLAVVPLDVVKTRLQVTWRHVT